MKAEQKRLKPNLPGFTETDLGNTKEKGTAPFPVCISILTFHHVKSRQATHRFKMTGHPQIRTEAVFQLCSLIPLYNRLLQVLREKCDGKAGKHVDKAGTRC